MISWILDFPTEILYMDFFQAPSTRIISRILDIILSLIYKCHDSNLFPYHPPTSFVRMIFAGLLQSELKECVESSQRKKMRGLTFTSLKYLLCYQSFIPPPYAIHLCTLLARFGTESHVHLWMETLRSHLCLQSTPERSHFIINYVPTPSPFCNNNL